MEISDPDTCRRRNCPMYDVIGNVCPFGQVVRQNRQVNLVLDQSIRHFRIHLDSN